MNVILSFFRDFFLDNVVQKLLAFFFATPFIWYVFVFSKLTPNLMTGLVIVFLIIGLTVLFEKHSNTQLNKRAIKIKDLDLKKFTKFKIKEFILQAENMANASSIELEAIRSEFTEKEYKQKLNLIQEKLNNTIRFFHDELERRENIIGRFVF